MLVARDAWLDECHLKAGLQAMECTGGADDSGPDDDDVLRLVHESGN